MTRTTVPTSCPSSSEARFTRITVSRRRAASVFPLAALVRGSAALVGGRTALVLAALLLALAARPLVLARGVAVGPLAQGCLLLVAQQHPRVDDHLVVFLQTRLDLGH